MSPPKRECGEDPDLELDANLYRIQQIFSVTLFEKTPILQMFQEGISQTDPPLNSTRLILFEL